MKKLRNYYTNLRHPNPSVMERRWVFPLAILSIVLLFLTTLTSPTGSPILFLSFYRSYSPSSSVFVESELHPIPISPSLPLLSSPTSSPDPRATADLASSAQERLELASISSGTTPFSGSLGMSRVRRLYQIQFRRSWSSTEARFCGCGDFILCVAKAKPV